MNKKYIVVIISLLFLVGCSNIKNKDTKIDNIIENKTSTSDYEDNTFDQYKSIVKPKQGKDFTRTSVILDEEPSNIILVESVDPIDLSSKIEVVEEDKIEKIKEFLETQKIGNNTKENIDAKVVDNTNNFEGIKVYNFVGEDLELLESISDDVKKNFFIIKSHCNEEDSYLLLDDIKKFKSFISEKTNKNIEMSEFIYSEYEDDISNCYKIYKSNDYLEHSKEVDNLFDYFTSKISNLIEFTNDKFKKLTNDEEKKSDN